MEAKTSGPRVLITHAYSLENKGDAALLAVLVSEARRVFAPTRVDILTLDEAAPGDTFEGVPLLPSFMSYARFRFATAPARVAYGLAMVVTTLLWARVRRLTGRCLPLPAHLRSICELYAAADIVIPVGGGYLRGLRNPQSLFNVALMVHPLYLAAVLGRPTVLFSQSVGPFGWRIEEGMVRRALNRCVDLVLVREDKSVSLLRRIGVTVRAERSVDSGFLLESNGAIGLRDRVGAVAGEQLVGFTVRKWLRGEQQEGYERAVAQLADHVVTHHRMRPVFIPQVTSETHGDDDRVTSRAVHAAMAEASSAVVLEDRFDHRQIKAAYSELDLLVGTRFHSVIFALTARVPALAVEYEHKTSGILADLGLSQWCLSIGTLSGPQLIETFDRLVDERLRYIQNLDERLPDYVARAHHAAELAFAVYADRSTS